MSDFALNLSLFILFIYKIKNKDSMEGVEVADDISNTDSNTSSLCADNNKKTIWNVMIKHCVLYNHHIFRE